MAVTHSTDRRTKGASSEIVIPADIAAALESEFLSSPKKITWEPWEDKAILEYSAKGMPLARIAKVLKKKVTTVRNRYYVLRDAQ